MEDVYHYTRSPAWEELVSKIQQWILLKKKKNLSLSHFSSSLLSFPKESLSL